MNKDTDKHIHNIFCCYCQIRGLFSVEKQKLEKWTGGGKNFCSGKLVISAF